MKESGRRRFDFFVAFLCGALCCALVGFFLSHRREPALAIPEISALPDAVHDSQQPVALPRQTFQRLPYQRPVAAQPRKVAEAQSVLDASAAPTDSAENGDTTETVRFIGQVVPVSSAITAARPRVGGRLTGRVTLHGTPPPEKPLPLDRVCAAKASKFKLPTTTRFYVVSKDHALADVVISLQGLPAENWAAPSRTNLIHVKACNFEPYISAVQAGEQIMVQNQDDALYPLSIDGMGNDQSHPVLYRQSTTQFALSKPADFVRLRNDSVPWAFSYVTVFDHPFFAVSDQNGEFVIAEIPPGHYTVQAHHRKAGIVTQEIDIAPNQNTNMELVIPLPGMPEIAGQ